MSSREGGREPSPLRGNAARELCSRIDSLLLAGNTVNVAIDGNSGAGKSTLATWISTVYDCNVFHMDDFFLPPQLRTAERLLEVGGNVDYARFEQEVLSGLRSGRQFQYRTYDCKQLTWGRTVLVSPKQLNIIEGLYGMHPSLVNHYQLKVFLSLAAEEQVRRILQRNGAAMLQRFTQEWIPLENRYFREMQVAAQSDLVFQP